MMFGVDGRALTKGCSTRPYRIRVVEKPSTLQFSTGDSHGISLQKAGTQWLRNNRFRGTAGVRCETA